MNFCNPAFVVAAPYVKYTSKRIPFSISNINNDFAQAGGPTNSV
jgi:hypothetical protein